MITKINCTTNAKPVKAQNFGKKLDETIGPDMFKKLDKEYPGWKQNPEKAMTEAAKKGEQLIIKIKGLVTNVLHITPKK